MRFMFIVQGEGRGNMTQAVSLSETLRKHGHEVVSVLIGKSKQRVIFSFFYEKIGAPVNTYESPNFIVGKDRKKVKVLFSVFYNLLKFSTYCRSLQYIHQKVKETQPDAVLNFYELMGGILFMVYRPSALHFCIGHQYMVFHPDFEIPRGKPVDAFVW